MCLGCRYQGERWRNGRNGPSARNGGQSQDARRSQTGGKTGVDGSVSQTPEQLIPFDDPRDLEVLSEF